MADFRTTFREHVRDFSATLRASDSVLLVSVNEQRYQKGRSAGTGNLIFSQGTVAESYKGRWKKGDPISFVSSDDSVTTPERFSRSDVVRLDPASQYVLFMDESAGPSGQIFIDQRFNVLRRYYPESPDAPLLDELRAEK